MSLGSIIPASGEGDHCRGIAHGRTLLATEIPFLRANGVNKSETDCIPSWITSDNAKKSASPTTRGFAWMATQSRVLRFSSIALRTYRLGEPPRRRYVLFSRYPVRFLYLVLTKVPKGSWQTRILIEWGQMLCSILSDLFLQALLLLAVFLGDLVNAQNAALNGQNADPTSTQAPPVTNPAAQQATVVPQVRVSSRSWKSSAWLMAYRTATPLKLTRINATCEYKEQLGVIFPQVTDRANSCRLLLNHPPIRPPVRPQVRHQVWPPLRPPVRPPVWHPALLRPQQHLAPSRQPRYHRSESPPASRSP